MKYAMKILATAATLLCAGCRGPAASKKPFDSSEWKKAGLSHSQGERSVRGQMLDDLLVRKAHLKGWSRQEVVDLLGQPSARMTGAATNTENYLVGHIKGCRPGYESSLVLTFDQDNKVADCGFSVD
jgi:hypothetical protein